MAQEAADGSFAIKDADFDALYRGEAFVGTELRFDRVPWDIGEPQPVLVELEDAGEFRGEVLDSGCGVGENALFLAERGHRVTGVDAAPTAIEEARRRAGDRGVQVEFATADVTKLDGFEQRFDTVLDSALYHCLGDEARTAYGAALYRATRPGAKLHLFCFADEGPSTFPPSFVVSQADLHRHLGQHWKITGIELTYYASAFTREDLVRMTNQSDGMAAMGLAPNPDEVETDDRGRVLISVWHLSAERT